MIGKQELRIKSRFERPTLKQVGKEGNREPKYDCSSCDEGTLLECGGGKDSAIKDQNGKLD